MTRKKIILTSLVAVALVLLTAGASAMITKEILEDKKTEEKVAVKEEAPVKKVTKTHKSNANDITWNERQPTQPAQPVRQASACDDGNIVGTVVGGLGGGLAGSQVGNGNGKIAATIAGTMGGAYLGNRYIPSRNVTCR